MPLISNSSFDNGVMWFSNLEANNEGNSITCSDTTLWADTMFYQKDDFIGYSHIQHLTPKFKPFNQDIANIIISSCRTSTSKKYDYGNKFNRDAMNKTIIQLPIKQKKEKFTIEDIDFNFIEDFMRELESERLRELESERLRELEAYLITTDLKDYTLTDEEQQTLDDFTTQGGGRKELRIGDLFNIKTGRDVIIWKVSEWKIPLISHQHDNNWITKYIAPLNNRQIFNHKNTIALADRWVFLATTQNQDFHIGTRLKALIFKEGEKNKNIRLFFTCAINKNQVFFTEYSDNATNKLPNVKINIPINKNNQPDYEQMEIFISAIQKLIIQDVVEYADRKIQAAKEIITKG